MKYAIVKNFGAVSISGAEQPQPEEQIKAFGDIVGFLIKITVSTTLGTGALGTGACAWNTISKFTVKDKSATNIIDLSNVTYGVHDIINAGNLLNMRLRGSNATAMPSLALDSTGAGSGTAFIPCYISMNDQPASLNVTFNSLSGTLSTVGTATQSVQLQVSAVYQDPVNQPTVRTKIYNVTGIAEGDNRLDTFIPDGVKLSLTGLYSANLESYLSKLVFSSAGMLEFENVSPSELVALEGELFPCYTHKTGLVVIPHLPFYKTNVTRLVATYSTGENVRVYHTVE